MEEKTTGNSYFKKDQIAIHTMPKRYLGSAKGSPAQAKSTGFLILATGAILLCAAFVLLYFYYSKPKEDISINQDSAQSQAVNKVLPSENTSDTPDKEYDIEEENDSVGIEPKSMDDYEDYDDYLAQIGRDIGPVETATSSEIAASAEEIAVSSSSEEEITENTATATPGIYTAANDTDGDGLSDIEELLLDCNIAAPDSDGDGYNDLAELLNLYNPAGNGKIIVNPNIAKYSNQTYNYSLYYPNIWILKTVGGDEALLFQISTDQFIQVAVEPNTEGKTIEAWYQEQFGAGYIPTDQKLDKEGWTGIKTPDGLVAYLNHPDSDNIFAISYNPGAEGMLKYINIFSMIVNSLELN